MNYGPYKAQVLKIHDGDTLLLELDLGFGLKMTLSCRIYGINCPELYTAPGKAALEYAKTLVAVGDFVDVTSHGWDKYGGRFDGTVTLYGTTDYASLMMAAGHAKAVKY